MIFSKIFRLCVFFSFLSLLLFRFRLHWFACARVSNLGALRCSLAPGPPFPFSLLPSFWLQAIGTIARWLMQISHDYSESNPTTSGSTRAPTASSMASQSTRPSPHAMLRSSHDRLLDLTADERKEVWKLGSLAECDESLLTAMCILLGQRPGWKEATALLAHADFSDRLRALDPNELDVRVPLVTVFPSDDCPDCHDEVSR